MDNYGFFAFLNRMKLISRWGLMHSSLREDAAQHTYTVTLIAHALALIDKTLYKKEVDPNLVGMIAAFHESAEVFTGDLPTPIKYKNEDIKNAYKTIEDEAENRLLNTLPKDLKNEYSALVKCPKDSYEYKLVKRADKIAALIKCAEELNINNKEFLAAQKSIQTEINSYQEPCVKYFVKNFLPSFYLSLDELTEN